MLRKKRFRKGQRVNALSLQGKPILGEYRGMAGSFGAFVFGIEAGSFEPASMHKCMTLTMEAVLPTLPRRPKPVKLAVGEACKSLTKDAVPVQGFFMYLDGQYAWIKGWPEGVSKFEPQQAIKVLRSHLEKV
jgi:hypothetical protein